MKFNFIKNRRIAFTISSIAFISSIIVTFIFGMNLGLDFTGGGRWTISFSEKVSQTQVKDFFNSLPELHKETKIQETTEGQYLITIEEVPDSVLKIIGGRMKEKFGDYKEIGYVKIDSAIGNNFKTKAIYALTVAIIGISLFIWFSFRHIPKAMKPLRFGIAAILALFHDVTIVFGIFIVLGKIKGVELDLPFLSALLGTLGYSVNDTIIILDRIRENIRFQKPNETFGDTVEKSIHETLRRTIITTLSAVFPLLALMFFGTSSIFYFVLALFLGISIGTYSSIFIVAPLLVSWKEWSDKKEA